MQNIHNLTKRLDFPGVPSLSTSKGYVPFEMMEALLFLKRGEFLLITDRGWYRIVDRSKDAHIGLYVFSPSIGDFAFMDQASGSPKSPHQVSYELP